MHWRRTWQPTPVFLPREPQGLRGLVGCRPWGHTDSDTTETTSQQQQQQQQQQQRQPSMKHSPSHPVGPKPHLDNMVPNALNVGLPDLQTKGPIPGYGSGKLLVCKLLVEKSASHTLSLR